MYPIIELAKNIALSNVMELPAPYKLTYALTYRCQLQCGMCNIWRQKPSREMTVEQIAAFFERTSGFSWINLSGGEIFLRPDLLAIIGAIASSCRSVYLLNFPTNGYLTDVIVDAVEAIIRSFRFPKLLVTVSLDGPPALHDQIRNTPGSWDRAVETYRRLRALKSGRFNVFLGMTLQDVNAHAFEETVRSVRDQIGNVRYQDVHVNLAHTSSHYYANAGADIHRDKHQTLSQLARIRTLRKTSRLDPVNYLERRYQRLASRYITDGNCPTGCQAFGASLFMDPAGTIYPCSGFDSPIGNIVDHDCRLDALWRAPRRRSIRREIIKGNCPQCWTPCEAYQSILADLVPISARYGR